MAKYSDLIEKKYELPDTAADMLWADAMVLELFYYLSLFDTSSRADDLQEKAEASQERVRDSLKLMAENYPGLVEDFESLAEAFYELVTETKYNSARAIVRNASSQIQHKRISFR